MCSWEGDQQLILASWINTPSAYVPKMTGGICPCVGSSLGITNNFRIIQSIFLHEGLALKQHLEACRSDRVS